MGLLNLLVIIMELIKISHKIYILCYCIKLINSILHIKLHQFFFNKLFKNKILFKLIIYSIPAS